MLAAATAADDISFRLIVSSHSPDLLVSMWGTIYIHEYEGFGESLRDPCCSSTLVPHITLPRIHHSFAVTVIVTPSGIGKSVTIT